MDSYPKGTPVKATAKQPPSPIALISPNSSPSNAILVHDTLESKRLLGLQWGPRGWQLLQAWVWVLLTTLCTGLGAYYSFRCLIDRRPVPPALALSPGGTVAAVNVVSQVLGVLLGQVIGSAYDVLRWTLAARSRGVSVHTSSALRKDTSIAGVLTLLVQDWHGQAIWCFIRLFAYGLTWAVSIVLLSYVQYLNIYEPVSTIPVLAGLAPLNLSSTWNSVEENEGFIFYTHDILTDSTLVKGVDPVSCTGASCVSLFYPGGVDFVRPLADLNQNTLFQKLTSDGSVILIENAPGYQVEFAPIDSSYTWDSANDCKFYGNTTNEGIYICLAYEDPKLLMGVSVCPFSIFDQGLCFQDLSWAKSVSQNTSMTLFRRFATVAYDRTNFSILDIPSIGLPVPAGSPNLVTDYNQGIDIVFKEISPYINSSISSFQPDAAALCSQSTIAWAIRFDETYSPTVENAAVAVLQGFLAVPIQFSTLLWELQDLQSLPSDMNTTALMAQVSYRAIAGTWTFVVFAISCVLLLLSATMVLLWASIFGRHPLPSPECVSDVFQKGNPFAGGVNLVAKKTNEGVWIMTEQNLTNAD